MNKLFWSAVLLLLLPLAACSPSTSGTGSSNGSTTQIKPLITGAIPDQDPQKLQRQYTKLAAYLQKELGVPVEYKPVTDYAAAVTAFKVGDLDLVWFGGLTGVQARLQVPGAEAIAQRDVDAKFHSVFITNKQSGLKPFKDIADVKQLKGHTFTFGSESSTSGRLMPQYFLQQAGVKLTDFKGEVGFSGDHAGKRRRRSFRRPGGIVVRERNPDVFGRDTGAHPLPRHLHGDSGRTRPGATITLRQRQLPVRGGERRPV